MRILASEHPIASVFIASIKPIFHWKMGPNANEIDIKELKYTWPIREFCAGDATQPLSHMFALGVGVGGNANFSVFIYLHVGVPNEKFTHSGSRPI